MEKLKRIFKTIRDDFHDQVPPLTVKVDQEHHYEVWAVNGGVANMFGKVVMHEYFVELSFYSNIDLDTEYDLFPTEMFKLMDTHFVLHINDFTPWLQDNIVEAIGNLIDYLREEKLLPLDEMFKS